VDIKKGGSLDSNLNFYDQVVRVGKGWVEHEFVLFIIGHIATWNKVAKWVNVLQDKMIDWLKWRKTLKQTAYLCLFGINDHILSHQFSLEHYHL
jgi:hypothetical protein